ncbi:hypothetical protein F5B18DRAFT_655156 [Nemania serpens]|nr:hypothetical protein F5B18DRAFT_655156 [Nemania serpens]
MSRTTQLVSHISHLPTRCFIAAIAPRYFTSTQPRSQDQSPAQNHDVIHLKPPPVAPRDRNNNNNNNDSNNNNNNNNNSLDYNHIEKGHNGSEKTTAQRDEELRQKMSGIAGDGGEAGVEYEDGQPVAMRRSVKNNMFRYI